MFVEIASQLRLEESSAAPTLEIAFPSKSICSIQVGFVVNQNPWSAMRSCQICFRAMRAKSSPQICGKANVESVIGFGSKNVNVGHIRSLIALARERSFYVPAHTIEELWGRRSVVMRRSGGRIQAAARGKGKHSSQSCLLIPAMASTSR
jgi:hypothetical protein